MTTNASAHGQVTKLRGAVRLSPNQRAYLLAVTNVVFLTISALECLHACAAQVNDNNVAPETADQKVMYGHASVNSKAAVNFYLQKESSGDAPH
ncbi:hypothetical protein BC835DRAFT_1411254 [Cytidiella melzeri]|nr:hypothetical protein BC835DRAFT_1411254 [Cytidiella melzeri]